MGKFYTYARMVLCLRVVSHDVGAEIDASMLRLLPLEPFIRMACTDLQEAAIKCYKILPR